MTVNKIEDKAEKELKDFLRYVNTAHKVTGFSGNILNLEV